MTGAAALPRGWVSTTLGEVCQVVGGATPSTKDPSLWGGDVPWVTPADLSSWTAKLIAGGSRSLSDQGLASCSAQLLPGGSVLFSSRAPIGHVAITTRQLATNQGFKSLVPPEGVLADYLYWYLRWATPSIRASASGTTFSEISGKAMRAVSLLLPPTAEQARIVAEIERRLSHVDAGATALRTAARLLSRARSAVLRSAVNGSLLSTETSSDAAKECEAAGVEHEALIDRPGWVRLRIADVAKVGSGATPKRGNPRYWDGGTIPWVTSGQVVGGVIREPAELITEAALAETSVKLWPAGTLLVAMYGEGRTRGHCAELSIEATCNQACAAIAIRPDLAGVQPWIKLVLQSRYEQNRTLGSGGVQENLNLGIIKDITIDLPPADVREVLIAEVDRRLSLLDAAALTIERQEQRAAAVRKATLAAAMSGRLVPQDPSDEPARHLLERIADVRALADPAKRARRRNKTSKENAQ
jgi:type I restriction enzyme, S subunit